MPTGPSTWSTATSSARTNVHAEYDTEISLTSWAAATWGAGEEWFIVTPPGGPQQPAPTATMSGPQTAVTGTDSHVPRDGAAEPGGSISGVLLDLRRRPDGEQPPART